ncbi:relaxin receptor 2-like [Anneissia japonica]|uniref:relaxin receptor 2-like n=1 Tax=Anneissia japonica TaxID=1529436 RepID=UPI0014259A0D|nr:relaxin receptor 2-like [Anneissia japonica]
MFKDYIDTITEIVTGNRYFQCASGFCLPKEYVCDGARDCYNGEDEEQCIHEDTDAIEIYEDFFYSEYSYDGSIIGIYFNDFKSKTT